MALKERTRFLFEFVRKPRTIGAVSPSSGALARKMVEWIDWSRVRTVVEYGPGTGACTRQILSRIQPGTKFFAIEINPGFVDILHRNYPDVRVYHDSVKNVGAICEREGVDEVGVIVSGLPWASFPHQDQVEFLSAAISVLKPGGQFVTFAYLQGLLLPAAQRFRNELRRHFSRSETGRIVWRNFPPALIYRCGR